METYNLNLIRRNNKRNSKWTTFYFFKRCFTNKKYTAGSVEAVRGWKEAGHVEQLLSECWISCVVMKTRNKNSEQER